jgi:prepilin peptidase CpaA
LSTTSLPIPHLIPLALGLAVAIGFDLGRRRIPNVVCALVFVFGLVVRGVDQGLLAALSGVGSAALILAILFRPWQAGGLGGGDVKLASATAAWVSFGQLVWFALATALAGGVVALACYLLSRAPARAGIRANLTLSLLHNELPPAPSHRAGGVSVPYALAIAAGAFVAFFNA